MMVRWSGEHQVNLNLSLTLLDVKLVFIWLRNIRHKSEQIGNSGELQMNLVEDISDVSLT